MGLEAKLLQKMSQSLLMTPQLQQAIKLLQLGRLEYKAAIEQELLENPVLEEQKDGSDDPLSSSDSGSNSADESPFDSLPGSTSETVIIEEATIDPSELKGSDSSQDWESYLETFSDSRGTSAPKGAGDHEDRPSIEQTLSRSETLYEHLIAQLRYLDLSEEEQSVVLHIIGNLNKDGLLEQTYEELAQTCGTSVETVERVIADVRSLDPAGVTARDLGECLLLQLERLGQGESLAGRIVKTHLDKVESRKFEQIAKLEKVTLEEVGSAIRSLRKLNPRPGRQFADDSTRYMVPDIYVHKDGSEYVITLNEEGLPRLRVNPMYLKMLREGAPENSPNKAYINERLKAASWLIKTIHQRQSTIYKVTESIVKYQRDFFDRGIQYLKPLVLKDVADDIGMHESTVSRVTTNKFVHTPQGVFELKFFFTTGLKSGDSDISSSSVKDKIKLLIASEPANNPISDQFIVDRLKSEGIEIARRTVAKYREQLGIESSSKRKKII